MHYSRCPTQRTLAVCEAHKRSKQSQKVVSITPRRHLLLAGGAAATTTLLTSPTPALAALDTSNSTALLQSLWDSLTGVQPEAVRYPRKQLDLPFAVLMMRSGYDAVDDLDFIPMDKFQIMFWKLRQSEFEPYLLLYNPLPIKTGDLSDPLYFDFISFAQFATISKAIPMAQVTFEERCEECDGDEKRIVVRDATKWGALDKLPSTFPTRLADRLYTGLSNGFRGQQFGGPLPAAPDASVQTLAQGAQQIVDIFVAKGFALKGDVIDVQGGGFTVRMEGPANLWGLAALAARRSLVVNTYDAYAIDGYLRASGCIPTYRSTRTETGTTTTFSL